MSSAVPMLAQGGAIVEGGKKKGRKGKKGGCATCGPVEGGKKKAKAKSHKKK